MPREIVFTLNGGGDVTAEGGVDWPNVVVVDPSPVPTPVSVPGGVGVVGVVVEPGATTGEKIAPTA
jgi:hypothetical protein